MKIKVERARNWLRDTILVIGTLSTLGCIAFGIYFIANFHRLTDVSINHCVSVISEESKLVDQERMLLMMKDDLEKREAALKPEPIKVAKVRN